MNHIHYGVWLGDSHDARNPGDIRAILNCAHDLRIKYDPTIYTSFQLGLSDSGENNNIDTYVLGAKFLHLMVLECKKVLVHCHEGRQRSPAIVILWLMMMYNETFDEAVQMVRPAIMKCRGVEQPVDWKLRECHEAAIKSLNLHQ